MIVLRGSIIVNMYFHHRDQGRVCCSSVPSLVVHLLFLKSSIKTSRLQCKPNQKFLLNSNELQKHDTCVRTRARAFVTL